MAGNENDYISQHFPVQVQPPQTPEVSPASLWGGMAGVPPCKQIRYLPLGLNAELRYQREMKACLGVTPKGDEVCPAWLATEHLPDGLQKTEIWEERLKSRDLSLLEMDLPGSAESVGYSLCKHFLPF